MGDVDWVKTSELVVKEIVAFYCSVVLLYFVSITYKHKDLDSLESAINTIIPDFFNTIQKFSSLLFCTTITISIAMGMHFFVKKYISKYKKQISIKDEIPICYVFDTLYYFGRNLLERIGAVFFGLSAMFLNLYLIKYYPYIVFSTFILLVLILIHSLCLVLIKEWQPKYCILIFVVNILIFMFYVYYISQTYLIFFVLFGFCLNIYTKYLFQVKIEQS